MNGERKKNYSSSANHSVKFSILETGLLCSRRGAARRVLTSNFVSHPLFSVNEGLISISYFHLYRIHVQSTYICRYFWQFQWLR